MNRLDKIKSNIRAALVYEMVDCGELVRVTDDIYEDMGGHAIHVDHLDGHINEWLKHMDPRERDELVKRTGMEHGMKP